VKRANWLRVAQLSAVALALVLVLGAGGYGITRGFWSGTKSCGPPTDGFNIVQFETTVVPVTGGATFYTYSDVTRSPKQRGLAPCQ